MHPTDPNHPNFGLKPAKKRRPQPAQTHEPAAPEAWQEVYRMQCSACADYFSTWTCPKDHPPLHVWYERAMKDFADHHSTYDGWHEEHCGGTLVVTRDGQPFTWPANPDSLLLRSIIKAKMPQKTPPMPPPEMLATAAAANPEAAAAARKMT